MFNGWKLAQENLKKTQGKQKCQHDKNARDFKFTVWDHVFVHIPAFRSGPACRWFIPSYFYSFKWSGVTICPITESQAHQSCLKQS